MTENERLYLLRCLELAREALEAGDQPFGSVLVGADGKILAEDRNRTSSGDSTRHPEFELARWATRNLTPEQRASATVYTSGEHCPMCSAAHAWVGLGGIVYIASSAQLRRWLDDWGIPPGPVAPLPIQEVAPAIPVRGPIPDLEEEIRALYRRSFKGDEAGSLDHRDPSE